MLDAARAHREQQVSQSGSVKTERNYTTCLVRNNSGAAVDRFGILAVGDPIILPDDSLEQFVGTIAFEGDTPTGSDGSKWCVLLEPIPDDGIGLAVISGVIPVQVAAGSGAEDYVQPATGDTDALAFSSSGSALVLWEEGSGDPRWALVRLGDGAGSGASGVTVQEQDGSPSYTSTTTIQVNQDDGLRVTQPGANTALISIVDASGATPGIINGTTQTMAGVKTWTDGITIGPNTNADYDSVAKFSTDTAGLYGHIRAFPDVGGSIAYFQFRAIHFDAIEAAYGFVEAYAVDATPYERGVRLATDYGTIIDAKSIGNARAIDFVSTTTTINATTAASGTDALGNVFTQGWCTTVGGGSIPSAYTDEMARDAIGTALTNGTGISISVNDGADTITISTTITQYTDEMARDALGTALTEGYLIDIAVNDGSDTITLEKKFRGCRAYKNGGTCPGTSSTWGSLGMDAEIFDTNTIHDNSTNNSRFTIPSGMGGYWRFFGFIYPDPTASGGPGHVFQVRLLLNGATVLAASIGELNAGNTWTTGIVERCQSFSAGDYVELQAYHNSGTPLALYSGDGLNYLECEFLGVAP